MHTTIIESAPVESTESMATRGLRILVVDDHDLMRQGLRFVLGAQSGWVVCGEAATGRDAVRSAQELNPDVVVIDVHMPDMDGLQAAQEIRAFNPQIEVLILTIDETWELVRAATEVGASGVVMKSDAARDLVTAVAALARHEVFFTAKASQIIVQGVAQRPLGTVPVVPASLTRREHEVVVMVAQGHSTKQVAAALNISAKTVESHRHNIMHKLGLKSVAELVRYAVRCGLVSV
jgi:two-component system, NarL family, response regulator NreC